MEIPSRMGLYIAGIALVLLLLASWGLTQRQKGGAAAAQAKLDHVIRVLYRQCGRWAMAAEQDESPLVGLLHANYATGYLWAIKDIASSDEFRRATGGEEFLSFEGRIVRTQDTITRSLVAACPTLAAKADPMYLRAAYTYPEAAATAS